MSDHPPIAFTQARALFAIDEEPLFSVNAGVAVSDALEFASSLLGGITYLAMNASEDEAHNALTQNLLEMTKALVDAGLAGIWEKEREAYAKR